MAHSIAGAFKPKKSDEMYTPRILVEPIIKHIRAWYDREWNMLHRPIILCPFDTENSEFVQVLKEEFPDLTIEWGHIKTGQDFFTHDYGHYDLIVSNPPFSRKKDVWEKLLKIGKPFALLSNLMCINYMEIGSLFADYPIQMLCFDKRVSFDGNPSSFSSGYFCHKFLEKDLIFEHLPHCNSGKNYVPSSMYKEKL